MTIERQKDETTEKPSAAFLFTSATALSVENAEPIERSSLG